MGNELQVAILEPAGAAGLELVRLLLRHPHLKPPLLLSQSRSGSSISRLLPELNLNGDGDVHPFSWSRIHQRGTDLLFLSGARAKTRALAGEAAAHGLLVIDLTGLSGRQMKGTVRRAVREINAIYGWSAAKGRA